MRSLRTHFNNVFAVLVVLLVFAATFLDLPFIARPNDFVMGVMWGTGFTLIVQYFFRKAPPPEPPAAPKS